MQYDHLYAQLSIELQNKYKTIPFHNTSLITEQPYSWELGVLYTPDSPAHPKPNLETYKPEKDTLRENISLIQMQWK